MKGGQHLSFQHLSFQQRRDWLCLIKSENVGPVSFFKLLERFGDAATALRALPEISHRGGLKRPIRICSPEIAEQDLQAAENIGAKFIAACEPEYPQLLRHTDGPPPLICAKGRFELLNTTSIAMVGSRNASAVGLKFARTLASEFGQAGYTTISGLARGIDTSVHQASLHQASLHQTSLQTGTIAVVAGGVDVFYPPENKALHEEIFDNGLVVSEMMPGTRPQARHFPRRNRLISGISRGTVVVEAAIRSGSLITARLAGEQNREVFAVPGSPLDPRAAGTNRLIQNGAMLVTKAQDVLDVMADIENRQIAQGDYFADSGAGDFGIEENIAPESHDTYADASIQQQIIALLSPSPTNIDDLARESGASISIIHGVLLELELAGRLERHTGQRVSLN